MIDPKVKDLFWNVVMECLMKFHRFKAVDAIEKTDELRTRIGQPPTGISNEIFYHSEPFYVACDLAGKELDLKECYKEYEALLIKNKWPELVTKKAGYAMGVIEETKKLLSEDRFRIKLHDLVAAQVREVIPRISDEQFPILGNWSEKEFVERLKKYEETTSDLRGMQALLGYWGTEANRGTLTSPIKQICGRLKPVSGVTGWIGLRWYPALLLLYVGGIAAVAAGKYDNLRALLQANISDPEQSYEGVTLTRRISGALDDIGDAFKKIPGHESHYTPRSEYLLQLLKPTMEDLLFLGIEYESYFDRFEVLFALEHAEQYASEQSGQVWGPIGRFGWKFRKGDRSSPLHRVIAEAEAQGDSWPPIVAGLFKGSANRFKEIASGYSQLIGKLGWW